MEFTRWQWVVGPSGIGETPRRQNKNARDYRGVATGRSRVGWRLDASRKLFCRKGLRCMP